MLDGRYPDIAKALPHDGGFLPYIIFMVVTLQVLILHLVVAIAIIVTIMTTLI